MYGLRRTSELLSAESSSRPLFRDSAEEGSALRADAKHVGNSGKSRLQICCDCGEHHRGSSEDRAFSASFGALMPCTGDGIARQTFRLV